MDEPRLDIVPDGGVYTPPQCRQCDAPFAHDGQQWVQACDCPATNGILQDGRWRMATYSPAITLIGQPRRIHCILCQQPLTTSETAWRGAMGPHSYIGYGHVACYGAEQQRVAAALAEARAAAQGPQITVWYGPDAEVVAAPRTGHADAEARGMPAELPDLPAGAVIYDELRRPFAKARIAFPAAADADAWWRAATTDPGVSYELFWFEPQTEQASREWRGRGFSAVESRARITELMAQPEEY